VPSIAEPMATATDGLGAQLVLAVEALRASVPVAFPTETVWGVAANARSDSAVARLRRWKGRDAAQPIAVLVSRPDALDRDGFEMTHAARLLVEAFWPGPLTLVLRSRARFADGIASAAGTVGVRCSSHPIAAGLALAAEQAGIGPVTATSMNRSGEPAVTSHSEALALESHTSDAPYVISPVGSDAGGGAASSVVDVSGERPRLLRRGAIDVRAIARALAVLGSDGSTLEVDA